MLIPNHTRGIAVSVDREESQYSPVVTHTWGKIVIQYMIYLGGSSHNVNSQNINSQNVNSQNVNFSSNTCTYIRYLYSYVYLVEIYSCCLKILKVDILGSWHFGSWYFGSWHSETNSIYLGWDCERQGEYPKPSQPWSNFNNLGIVAKHTDIQIMVWKWQLEHV